MRNSFIVTLVLTNHQVGRAMDAIDEIRYQFIQAKDNITNTMIQRDLGRKEREFLDIWHCLDASLRDATNARVDALMREVDPRLSPDAQPEAEAGEDELEGAGSAPEEEVEKKDYDLGKFEGDGHHGGNACKDKPWSYKSYHKGARKFHLIPGMGEIKRQKALIVLGRSRINSGWSFTRAAKARHHSVMLATAGFHPRDIATISGLSSTTIYTYLRRVNFS